jgi:hypothetical protein
MIIALASRHRLPAIYGSRFFAVEGGLISYGPDDIDQFRKAAGYVDRDRSWPIYASAREARRLHWNSRS